MSALDGFASKVASSRSVRAARRRREAVAALADLELALLGSLERLVTERRRLAECEPAPTDGLKGERSQ